MTTFFKNKKMVVTGGAGFFGINLTKRCLELGSDVRVSLHKNAPPWQDPSVEYVNADLEKAEDCLRICKGIDYLIIASANSSGAAVMDKTPLVHLTPNLIMNARLLEAAYAQGVSKTLFFSSNTVYPLTEFAVKESDANFEYFSKYYIVGWMKRFSEIMCDMYSNHIKNPMQTIVVRPGNAYGPFDKFEPEKSKVIPALIRRAVNKENPFKVWGNGNDLKDFIYIDDLVQGSLLALEKLNSPDPINIASGQPITIRKVLTHILKASCYESAEIQYDESMPSMIPKRMIDIQKANALLGFKPKVCIAEGIERTVKWYSENIKN
jgi:GDP-L-fucose synthase